jgi:hypothetical protein
MTRLQPSRLSEVLRPTGLGAVFFFVLGGASLAVAYDTPKAQHALGVLAALLLLPSLAAICPYMGSIGRQAFVPDFPTLGVRTAFVGCVGFATLIAIALVDARPLAPALAAIVLVAGILLGIADGIRGRTNRLD